MPAGTSGSVSALTTPEPLLYEAHLLTIPSSPSCPAKSIRPSSISADRAAPFAWGGWRGEVPRRSASMTATADYNADLQLFIAGAWRSGEGRDVAPVYNPATGAPIAELPVATVADLDEALAAAETAWPQWRAKTPDERAALMHRAAQIIRERIEPIARLLPLEQGKPIAEARGEVASAAGLLAYFAEEGKRVTGRVLPRPAGQRAMVLKQPVGPAAGFSPWNFPVNLMVKKIAPALAAGCTVIAKAPEETPGCTSAIMRCLDDAGIPAGVAQLVYGVPDMISRRLLASPGIRK